MVQPEPGQTWPGGEGRTYETERQYEERAEQVGHGADKARKHSALQAMGLC